MELKKCPFCGNDAIVKSDPRTFCALVEEHGSAAVDIGCTNLDCGCSFWVYSYQHNSTDYETARQVAIERWNQRVGNA